MRCQRARALTVPRLVAPVVVTLGVTLWWVAASRRARATQVLAVLWAAARRRQEAAGRSRFDLLGVGNIRRQNERLPAEGFYLGASRLKPVATASEQAYLRPLLTKLSCDRAPDPGGFAFHTNNLAAGVTRAEVLVGFSESTENQAQVIGAIQNGIDYIG